MWYSIGVLYVLLCMGALALVKAGGDADDWDEELMRREEEKKKQRTNIDRLYRLDTDTE